MRMTCDEPIERFAIDLLVFGINQFVTETFTIS